MIKLPTEGRMRSIDKHNCNDIIFSDWIEACVGFSEDVMTRLDVIDILMEEEIYEKQSFAEEFVNILWNHLENRTKLNQHGLFYEISKNKIIRKFNWHQKIPHSFCLLLSLAPYYNTWQETSFVLQGELFEKMVSEAISVLFPSLKIFQTGWTKENANSNFFKNLALEIKKRLSLDDIRIERWDSSHAKEYGLDILCYFDLKDKRFGLPYYMMQCASGDNWRHKLNTPDMNLWQDILHPHHFGSRAFAMPFYISDGVFSRSSIKVGGLFLDRTRILKASDRNASWLSSSLSKNIKNWIEERIDRITEEDF